MNQSKKALLDQLSTSTNNDRGIRSKAINTTVNPVTKPLTPLSRKRNIGLSLSPEGEKQSMMLSSAEKALAQRRVTKPDIAMNQKESQGSRAIRIGAESLALKKSNILKSVLTPQAKTTNNISFNNPNNTSFNSKTILLSPANLSKEDMDRTGLTSFREIFERDPRGVKGISWLENDSNELERMRAHLRCNKLSKQLYETQMDQLKVTNYQSFFQAFQDKSKLQRYSNLIRVTPAGSKRSSENHDRKTLNDVAMPEFQNMTLSRFHTDDGASSNKERNLQPTRWMQSLKIYMNYIEKITTCPDVRESATMITYEDRAILYGGISQNLKEDVYVLYPPKSSILPWKWMQRKVRGDLPVEGRFGHSACIYKREMIIFGGERRYNATIKQRECLSDVRALNRLSSGVHVERAAK
eukprot:TRINITY_DN2675_c0_g2_i3.p1 TRINITY_DN2675_c0_g2~~TRINITY_DN2675_c0_g2_i3.p1  ORF type:complete len:411 (-),score=46.90 TRINITY_DN2675_c0_g2_i3:286-1518(-)